MTSTGAYNALTGVMLAAALVVLGLLDGAAL